MRNVTKKIISILVAAALCLSIVPFAVAADNSRIILRGDVNGDGSVNASDALMVLRKSVGYNDAGFNANRADLDNNGKVNASDALRVLQISVGSDDPTTYSKNEVIKFYADALDAVAYSEISVYYETRYKSKMVNDEDSTDYVEFDIKDDMTDDFSNGYDEAKYSIYSFCPSTRIDPSLVKAAKITKVNGGYQVDITLVEDQAYFDDYVPHKTYPYLLSYADCSESGLDGYYATDGTASFPGSQIRATVVDGCIEKIELTIPFEMHMTLYHDDYGAFQVTENGKIVDVYTFTTK